MKKLILLILCIIIGYFLLVFLAPDISSKIENTVGLGGTTENIRGIKTQFDEIITDVPSPQEFKSGALDIKDTIQGGLDTTKEKIDGVRSTLSGAQDTFNDTMNTIDTAVETVKTAKETVNSLNESTDGLLKLGESIKGTVNVEDVGEVTENN